MLKRDINFINHVKLKNEYYKKTKTWKDFTRKEQADLIMKYVDEINLIDFCDDIEVEQILFREII